MLLWVDGKGVCSECGEQMSAVIREGEPWVDRWGGMGVSAKTYVCRRCDRRPPLP